MNPSGIYNKYFELSRQFIDNFGKVITCYYDTGLTSTTNDVGIYNTTSYDHNGNPVQITSFGGREDQAQPATPQNQQFTTKEIRVRVYWEKSSNLLKTLGLNLQEKVCRINCYLSDVPSLKQAQFIHIDDQNNPLVKLKAVLVNDVIPYGLGPVRYGISYWKVVGE